MNTVLKKPEAVFFDWDGTLVDSFAFLHQAHNHTRAQFGKTSFSREEFSGYFGQPREKLYAEIYGQENIEDAKKHFESYVYANHGNLKPVEGAEDVLRYLSDMDVPCGVVTNKKRDLVDAEIRNCGWEDYFISVVGAGEAEEDKPSPAPLLMSMEKSGLALTTENTWFIGDTDNDLICANKVGCITVLIATEPEAAVLLEKYNVHLHKNNCTELARFLLQYA